MPLAAFLPFFTTLAGGVVALRLRHRIHVFMALASGVVVATAIAELLPEAYDLVGSGSALTVGIAALVGFVAFSLIEAFIHQTSFEHARDTHLPELIATSRSAGTRSLLGVVPPISLILHSALDGLAIGFGFQAGATIGFVVLLAVLAHDFADGMNVVTLALEAARGQRLAVGLLILDALAPLAGAALSTLVVISAPTLGLLLAWFAGVFLAVGAGHLLPEAQHQDPRQAALLVALFSLGAAIVVGIRAASV